MDSETKDLFTANAETISDAIEELGELAEGQNYGAFWGKFKEINGLFKERIFPNDRHQLTDKFRGIVSDMRQRQTGSANEITQALEALGDLSPHGSYKDILTNNSYEDFWAKVKEISPMFSLPLAREEKQELRQKFQRIIDETKVRQSTHEKDATECISGALDTLQELSQNRDYRGFWDKNKEIPATFKNNRTSREDNQALWQRYQNLCQDVKRIQQEQRDESENCKKGFYRIIDKIDIQIQCAQKFDDFQEIRENLEEAKGLTRSMLRHDREFCYPALNRYWEKSISQREYICEVNYLRLSSEVHSIGTSYLGCSDIFDIVDGALSMGMSALMKNGDLRPHEALKEIKEVQQKVHATYLDKYRRKELFESLQAWWNYAIEIIEANKESDRQKHENWIEDQRAWREKTEGTRDHKKGLLEKNEGFIELLEGQIEDLEERISNSRNSEKIETMEGWIQGKRNKIAEVQGQNRELQQQIDDIEGKLNN